MNATTSENFLQDVDVREIPWTKPVGAPAALTTTHVLIGAGTDGFEVALATASSAPRHDEVRALWKLRWGRRAAPVLLVVCYPDGNSYKAHVCGTKDDPAVIPSLDLAHLERICTAVLLAADPVTAERSAHRLLVGQKDQLIAGLTNRGLFATHELRHGVPKRGDWAAANALSAPLLTKSGEDLIRGLGYKQTPYGSTARLLSVDDTSHAVAVLLEENEMFDRPAARFGAASPVAQGLKVAKDKQLPWLIATRGTQIRLYPARSDVGVGRKGRTETFIELDLALLTDDDAAYLTLLFGAQSLRSGGSVTQIMAASQDHATALGNRLRERVYEDVVPQLAVAVANRMKSGTAGGLSDDDLQEAYHRTLLILFRLLFVAYAEDLGLLPYQRNPRYTKKALKTLARDFADNPGQLFDPEATDRWTDLLAVWKAVDDGNREWDVPAYNGGLFAADEHHPSGQAIRDMRLTNSEIGPALRDLLVDINDDGDKGPVDFRSLTVREFGTIYEGLLESSLSVAPTDLIVDPKTKAYLPATAGEANPAVFSGEVYFHNASGARKASGSYFTKSFAVEHLLDTALEPAISTHLAKVKTLLDTGNEAGAADMFFDFRIADLAMGSGHFLVAAIDRIADRFYTFLADRTISSVNDELARLATAAQEALGPNSQDIEIEQEAVLRRQIARRCIYGLDLNLMAVELSRLGIWIHTFVPGLPMSSLDHGLRVGNSLTGMGSVDEVLDVLEPGRDSGQVSFYADQIEDALATARDRLLRVARTAEATKAEVREAARAHAKAMDDTKDVRALLDAAVAVRLGLIGIPPGPDEAIAAGNSSVVRAKIKELDSAHMPYLFPEVFLRDNPGFDVFLGNPPWEKAHVEEHNFWTIRFPGLKGLDEKPMNLAIQEYREARPDLVAEYEAECVVADTIRDAILRSRYPGIGSGHVDLFQVFCWRTWRLLRHGGRAGMVLPRGATSGSGTAKWREEVTRDGAFEDVTFLMNDAYWVFDGVDNRLRCSLTTYSKGAAVGKVSFRGPYRSMIEYQARTEGLAYPSGEFLTWSEGAIFPMLPSPDSQTVFEKLRAHPRFDSAEGFSFRPVQGDFNATTHKALWKKTEYSGALPVLAGASYNLWEPSVGAAFGWADPDTIKATLRAKRAKQVRTARSAYFGLDAAEEIMPARISFRDRTNLTNTRSTLVALVPPNVALVHNAPFLVRRAGSAADEAYVLGVMASIPFDWYIRRWVDRHLTFDLLKPTPLPRPDKGSRARKRTVEVAGRLAAVDDRYTEWANAVGVPVGSVTDESTKNDLIAELDALVGLQYGLNNEDMEHVFATFHRGWDYKGRLDATLAHFDAWNAKDNL